MRFITRGLDFIRNCSLGDSGSGYCDILHKLMFMCSHTLITGVLWPAGDSMGRSSND